jgi:hypothetical protein
MKSRDGNSKLTLATPDVQPFASSVFDVGLDSNLVVSGRFPDVLRVHRHN